MFLKFKDQAERNLNEALKRSGYVLDGVDLRLSEHADLESTVAFKLAPIYKKDPLGIANQIASQIKTSALISKVEARNGYINFFMSHEALRGTLKEILKRKNHFGDLSNEGKIIVEHTSANPNGPLHVGHIRNAIIGDTIVRILRKAGYQVESQYYVNDMGRQIAMVVWNSRDLKFDKKPDHQIADVYIHANKAMEAKPEVEYEINEVMRKYEEGDVDTMESFFEVVNLCLSAIKDTMKNLNIEHDRFIWETQFRSASEKIVDELKSTEYTEKQEKALVLDLKSFGIDKDLVIQRSDGTSLYPTRDIAYHKWKGERCDRMIDVLGSDHKLVSAQLRCALGILGLMKPDVVISEFVSLPGGSISTRKGKYITVDELIEKIVAEATKEILKRREVSDEFISKTSRIVGIGALRYDMIRVSPEKSLAFDLKAAINLERRGGPFVQYSHARACSILRKDTYAYDGYDLEFLFEEPLEIDLIRKMAVFPYIIETISESLKPNLLASYARELAELFNQFYRDIHVISSSPELKKARLALVDAFRIVIAESLRLLGIEAPESM